MVKSKSQKSAPRKRTVKKVYTGYKGKYVAGLKGKKLEQRKRELARNQRLKKSGSTAIYNTKYWKTDRGVKTKRSQYTERFHRKYGENVKSLPQIARATGFPLSCLQQVFKRGLAAWGSGHRRGASQSAWAYARVFSFVTGGKTSKTADKKLYQECKRRK